MIIIDTPPAGTACASCRTKKHFCPARTYRGDDPACEACAEGRDCDTVITLRRLKEPWRECAEEPAAASIAPVRTLDPASVAALPAVEVSIPLRHPGNCAGARSEAAALHSAVEVRRRKSEYANKKGRREASAPPLIR